MAAFGISFPKLTFCRASTSKIDSSTDSTIAPVPTPVPTPVLTTTTTTRATPVPTATLALTTATPATTTTTSTTIPMTGVRTLSLSIKNIPSQPLHYDVSTTTVKKKTTSFTTMLAIDGETKQLPKTLSVFNELQLDDEARNIDEKRRQEENSSDIIVPSSLSPMGNIDYHPHIRFLANNDSKKILHDSNDKEKNPIQDQRSNQTFTPPTVTLSNESSFNDLHSTTSSISVDLSQLKYAIEKFLVDDNDPVYQIAEELSARCSFHHLDCNGNAHRSNETTSDLKYYQEDQINNVELHPIHHTDNNNEVSSHLSSMSNNMKWYVSELRINRPLIYRTEWTNRHQRGNDRKLSHSVIDLKQMYRIINRSENINYKAKIDTKHDIVCSNLSLQYLNYQNQQQRRHQSDDNILLNNRLSCSDDDLDDLKRDELEQHQSPIFMQRTLDLSLGKDETLITNESVKKKLFDILNDDELENACLEDMSQEFEKLSMTHHHQNGFDLPNMNSYSSSSDDVLYSSSPNEFHLPLPSAPALSSSYHENLSTIVKDNTEYYFCRSRLITASLDKIPMNYNTYDHNSSLYLSRPSYEKSSASWYTSPSPQWRTDDQITVASVLRKHSSQTDDHLNGIGCIDPNQLLRTNIDEYGVNEHKYIEKYNHHNRKEQKHVSYSLLNTSTPLINDSTAMLPIIQDKSSNILMFI